MRHVPKPVDFMMTQSPLFRFCSGEREPVERISKQPSLPPTALGEEVPRRLVRGGLEG